jgi:hypothetical protein
MTGICEHEENEREDTAPGGKEMMHSALVLAAAARRSAEINGQARGCRRRAQDTTRGPVRCIRALWCVNEHPLQHAEPDKAGAVCLLRREVVSGHRLCSRERTIGAEPLAGCLNGSLAEIHRNRASGGVRRVTCQLADCCCEQGRGHRHSHSGGRDEVDSKTRRWMQSVRIVDRQRVRGR